MISLSLLSQTADWAIAWSAVCRIMQDFDLVSMAKEGSEFPTDKLVVSYRETGSYIPTNSKSVFSVLSIKYLV